MTTDATPTGPNFTAADLLTFEAENPHPAGKDTLIRQRFGLTRTRYWQILLQFAATSTAQQLDPITCRRILTPRPRTTHRP
jgi:hypothetical protein